MAYKSTYMFDVRHRRIARMKALFGLVYRAITGRYYRLYVHSNRKQHTSQKTESRFNKTFFNTRTSNIQYFKFELCLCCHNYSALP